MTQFFQCSNGHHWEASAGSEAESSLLALSCPVCGTRASKSTADGLAGSPDQNRSLAADELPPLPWPAENRPSPAPKERVVAGYEILEELGRGGMGVVYKARQISLNRVVALKMLLAGPHAADQEMARFRAEAETIAKLHHANIVHIYDIGEQDGHTYLALEFVEGGSLAHTLAGRPQPAREAARLVQKLAQAIHAVHLRGIIHRDLKPANILLQSPQLPKITDFGLAKSQGGVALTQTGAVMGTPSYMAPEQAEGRTKDISPATDVYALGVILYEMLTGRLPFDGPTTLEIIRKVVTATPVPPSEICDVPRDLESICLHCLEKDTRRRYASAQDLADDLDRFLNGSTLEMNPANPRLPGEQRRQRRLVGLVAGFAAIVVVALLLWNQTPDWLKQHPVEQSGSPSPQAKSDPAPPPVLKAKEDQVAASMAKVENTKPAPQPPPQPKIERQPTWETITVAAAKGEEKFLHIDFVNRQLGFLGTNKAISKTEDGGQTWKPVFKAAFLSQDFGLLRFQDTRTGWMVCNSKVYHTEDAGESWTPQEGVGGRALAMGPGGWVLAGGGGKLFQRRAPKTTWEELDFAKGSGSDPHGQLDSVIFIGVASPQIAFVATNGNLASRTNVFRTIDGGKTWTEVFKRGSRLGGLHFADAKQGWLMAGSALWATQDGGDTWKPQLNPEDRDLRFLSFDPRGSTTGLAAVYGGNSDTKLLVTADGKKWNSVDLDLKNAHFVSATVIDAGAALVLTEDGRIIRWR